MACEDMMPSCEMYKEQGKCKMEPGKMAMYCKKSCGFCDKGEIMIYFIFFDTKAKKDTKSYIHPPQVTYCIDYVWF